MNKKLSSNTDHFCFPLKKTNFIKSIKFSHNYPSENREKNKNKSKNGIQGSN